MDKGEAEIADRAGLPESGSHVMIIAAVDLGKKITTRREFRAREYIDLFCNFATELLLPEMEISHALHWPTFLTVS